MLYPFGATNADKMRSFSIAVMLKDEVDAWPENVGKDGDPDKLSDARCRGYWEDRKIFRGSTPLIKGASVIERQYRRGDQRKYRVLCKSCNAPQELRWEVIDKETGEVLGGFRWDYNSDGSLAMDSVRYVCRFCQHEHPDSDRVWLVAEENGAHWYPTSEPVQPGIRSYHLPAFYSTLTPWYQAVGEYLDAWDIEAGRPKSNKLFQTFYNNILASTYEVLGSRVTFRMVSGHRRAIYRRGEIPNAYAVKHSGSRVLLLTMTVDVHKANLAVAVMGLDKGHALLPGRLLAANADAQ